MARASRFRLFTSPTISLISVACGSVAICDGLQRKRRRENFENLLCSASHVAAAAARALRVPSREAGSHFLQPSASAAAAAAAAAAPPLGSSRYRRRMPYFSGTLSEEVAASAEAAARAAGIPQGTVDVRQLAAAVAAARVFSSTCRCVYASPSMGGGADNPYLRWPLCKIVSPCSTIGSSLARMPIIGKATPTAVPRAKSDEVAKALQFVALASNPPLANCPTPAAAVAIAKEDTTKVAPTAIFHGAKTALVSEDGAGAGTKELAALGVGPEKDDTVAAANVAESQPLTAAVVAARLQRGAAAAAGWPAAAIREAEERAAGEISGLRANERLCVGRIAAVQVVRKGFRVSIRRKYSPEGELVQFRPEVQWPGRFLRVTYQYFVLSSLDEQQSLAELLHKEQQLEQGNELVGHDHQGNGPKLFRRFSILPSRVRERVVHEHIESSVPWYGLLLPPLLREWLFDTSPLPQPKRKPEAESNTNLFSGNKQRVPLPPMSVCEATVDVQLPRGGRLCAPSADSLRAIALHGRHTVQKQAADGQASFSALFDRMCQSLGSDAVAAAAAAKERRRKEARAAASALQVGADAAASAAAEEAAAAANGDVAAAVAASGEGERYKYREVLAANRRPSMSLADRVTEAIEEGWCTVCGTKAHDKDDAALSLDNLEPLKSAVHFWHEVEPQQLVVVSYEVGNPTKHEPWLVLTRAKTTQEEEEPNKMKALVDTDTGENITGQQQEKKNLKTEKFVGVKSKLPYTGDLIVMTGDNFINSHEKLLMSGGSFLVGLGLMKLYFYIILRKKLTKMKI